MAGGLSQLVDGGAAAGGKALGGSIALWTAYRLFVFVCNFLAGRHDARQTRLDALEVRLSTSLGKRLAHLEEAEEANQTRIRLLEECVAILTMELRSENPNNPKLREVGRMLSGSLPIVPPDPTLNEIMQHAANAVDRGSKP